MTTLPANFPTTKSEFTLAEAAAYLGYAGTAGVRHHVYNTRRLIPDHRTGPLLIFTRATLDDFARVQTKGGWQRGKKRR